MTVEILGPAAMNGDDPGRLLTLFRQWYGSSYQAVEGWVDSNRAHLSIKGTSVRLPGGRQFLPAPLAAELSAGRYPVFYPAGVNISLGQYAIYPPMWPPF